MRNEREVCEYYGDLLLLYQRRTNSFPFSFCIYENELSHDYIIIKHSRYLQSEIRTTCIIHPQFRKLKINRHSVFLAIWLGLVQIEERPVGLPFEKWLS